MIRNSFIGFLLVLVFSCHAQQSFQLEPTDFSSKIKSTKDAVVLDVRTAGEFAGGFINNAINLDWNDGHFQDKMALMDHSKPYFVYCLSGGRSGDAAKLMRDNGFVNVFELKGGMMAWNKMNLPVSMKQPVVLDKISADEFQSIIHKMRVVLIDFYAPWCGPCKKIKPILDELEKEYQGKVFITRINIDENKKLTRDLGIDEIPFFKLYIDGKESGNYIGQMDKASFIRILDQK